MKCPVRLLAVTLLIGFAQFLMLQAQTVVAFQGGEGSPSDNWTFQAIANVGGPIPPGIVGANPRTGINALRVGGGGIVGTSGTNCIAGGFALGCLMHGNTIQFDPINVSCLPNVQFSVFTSSQGCSGAGFDAGDDVNFEVRLDGGSWVNVQNFAGFNEYLWTYSTPLIGPTNTVPNPWIYNVPANTNTFEFRLRLTVNRSDEVVYLDDVTLTTSSTAYGFPGTPGLWNGAADDNWFNPCNWNDRTVPTAATDVTFPAGSCSNDIVIQPGQNCQCNHLTLTGTPGHQIKGQADPSKVLTCFGDINFNLASAAPAINFDDAIPSQPDGTINLHGNWNNNTDEASFSEGESKVNFIGSSAQAVSLFGVQPYEIFGDVVVNKPSGTLTLNKSMEALGVLTLTSGIVTTGANHVFLANNLPSAVTGQNLASYINGNLRRNILTGPGTSTYDFPMGTATNYELASLTLVNPGLVAFIDAFFDPAIGGTPPSISEVGYLYDDILNAGVWAITPTPNYSGTYDVSLSERGYSNGGAASYINVKRPNSLSLWTNPGTHVTFSEAGGTVNCQRSGLTTFSEFAIALSNTVFAASDVALDATSLGGGRIAVQWDWANTDLEGEFSLERLLEGESQQIGQWAITPAHSMSLMDANAPSGLLRYQLRHIDQNGNSTLVASDEVWNTASGSLEPLIWPNPNDGIAHLQLQDRDNWSMSICRVDGAEMLAINGMAIEVELAFEEKMGKLAAGMYLVKLTSGSESYQLKVLRR